MLLNIDDGFLSLAGRTIRASVSWNEDTVFCRMAGPLPVNINYPTPLENLSLSADLPALIFDESPAVFDGLQTDAANTLQIRAEENADAH